MNVINGVTQSAKAGQTPIFANDWQVPWANAIARASNPGCLPSGKAASINETDNFPWLRDDIASANVAPAIPPPTMITFMRCLLPFYDD